jgi:hypothetical protein
LGYAVDGHLNSFYVLFDFLLCNHIIPQTMSNHTDSLTRTLAIVGVVWGVKAILDCMFAITIADNESAWDSQTQAYHNVTDQATALEAVKLFNKRRRANEWIEMSMIGRLVRFPPFECLKR